MDGTLLLLLPVAAALAAGARAAPSELSAQVIRVVPGPGAPAPLLVPGGVDDDVLMVPVAGGPLAVAELAQGDEEEEKEEEGEGEEDPWAVISSWLGLDGTTDAPAAPAARDGGPLKYFSAIQSMRSQPEDGGDGVVVLRVGRGLKSAQEDALHEGRESRVLEQLEEEEEDRSPLADQKEEALLEDGQDGVERQPQPRARRALRLVVRPVRQVGQEEAGAGAGAEAGRADASSPAPPAAPGSFLETVQNQLPGQLQGLGGAMEDSRMIVGTFQAVIMPGSAATDLGQQIQGFISNMPQVPQLPAGG